MFTTSSRWGGPMRSRGAERDRDSSFADRTELSQLVVRAVRGPIKPKTHRALRNLSVDQQFMRLLWASEGGKNGSSSICTPSRFGVLQRRGSEGALACGSKVSYPDQSVGCFGPGTQHYLLRPLTCRLFCIRWPGTTTACLIGMTSG